jgi:hypothetical protein
MKLRIVKNKWGYYFVQEKVYFMEVSDWTDIGAPLLTEEEAQSILENKIMSEKRLSKTHLKVISRAEV